MNENILVGSLTAAGALAYNAWGFWNAWVETRGTKEQERFDIGKTVTTVVPSVVLGFMAGYQMSPSSIADFVGLFAAGFGVAAAQSKLGIKNFFTW